MQVEHALGLEVVRLVAQLGWRGGGVIEIGQAGVDAQVLEESVR